MTVGIVSSGAPPKPKNFLRSRLPMAARQTQSKARPHLLLQDGLRQQLCILSAHLRQFLCMVAHQAKPEVETGDGLGNDGHISSRQLAIRTKAHDTEIQKGRLRR